MRKRLALVTAVFVLIICAIILKKEINSNIDNNSPNNKPIIKIGVNLPLTGNVAYMGQAIKGSVKVAEEDLNKRDLKNEYEFIIEDNAYDTKHVVSINNKFAYIDKVDAIIDFASISGLITSQFSEAHKIIHFNACSSDRNVAKGKYNFLHTTLPDLEAKILVNDVISNYKNVALIVLNDASGNATSIDMRNEMRKKGIKFTEYLINPGEVNMNSLLEKIEMTNPDVYLIALYSPTFEIFYKQMREKGINKPITSTHFFDNITNLKELPDGTTWVAYANPKETIKQKILSYNEGLSDYMVCLGNPYDITFILVDAFENNKEGALEYLNNIKSFDGVFGKIMIDNDGVINTPPIKKVLKSGKSVTVEE